MTVLSDYVWAFGWGLVGAMTMAISLVTKGISEPLLKWKAIEVAHELSKSPNTKIVILGDKSGLPIILGDR